MFCGHARHDDNASCEGCASIFGTCQGYRYPLAPDVVNNMNDLGSMLGKAFTRDDRDLLLDLGRRLAAQVGHTREAAQIAGAASPNHAEWYHGRSDLAQELLALFPDDLR